MSRNRCLKRKRRQEREREAKAPSVKPEWTGETFLADMNGWANRVYGSKRMR